MKQNIWIAAAFWKNVLYLWQHSWSRRRNQRMACSKEWMFTVSRLRDVGLVDMAKTPKASTHYPQTPEGKISCSCVVCACGCHFLTINHVCELCLPLHAGFTATFSKSVFTFVKVNKWWIQHSKWHAVKALAAKLKDTTYFKWKISVIEIQRGKKNHTDKSFHRRWLGHIGFYN